MKDKRIKESELLGTKKFIEKPQDKELRDNLEQMHRELLMNEIEILILERAAKMNFLDILCGKDTELTRLIKYLKENILFNKSSSIK